MRNALCGQNGGGKPSQIPRGVPLERNPRALAWRAGEIAATPVKPALWDDTKLVFYLCFCFPFNLFSVSVSQVWKQQACNFGRIFLGEFLIVLLFI